MLAPYDARLSLLLPSIHNLDEAAEHGRVAIQSGDIVLLRTGRIQVFHEMGALPYLTGPGSDDLVALNLWHPLGAVVELAPGTRADPGGSSTPSESEHPQQNVDPVTDSTPVAGFKPRPGRYNRVRTIA